VVQLDECFRVDGIRKTCKLIYFGIDVFLDISQEVFVASLIPAESSGNFLRDVKIGHSCSTLELSECDLFIRLGDHDLLLSILVTLVLEQSRVALQKLLEDSLTLICQYFLHATQRLQKRRSCQNLEANLHPLDVVHVHILFLALEHGADDQTRADGHLIELFDIKVFLALDCQFRERDSYTARQEIILSNFKSFPEWEIVFILSTTSLFILVVQDDRLSTVRSIWQNDCFSDDFWCLSGLR